MHEVCNKIYLNMIRKNLNMIRKNLIAPQKCLIADC